MKGIASQNNPSRPLLLLLPVFLLSGLVLTGCPSSRDTAKSDADSSNIVRSIDPFAELDDMSVPLDSSFLVERLEAARQEWLRALAAELRKDKVEVVERFENAIAILDRLIYYPNVSENTDFQELIRSVFEDYEKYVSAIDELPPNASIFALRQKFNEDLAKIDLRKLSIPKGTALANTQVPLIINEHVEKSMAWFLEGNGRSAMTRWLGRSGKFFPMMREIFKEEGVPEELIYLSMIESGMNPTVVSKAQAVGLWQFIQSTGAAYGLRVNYWFDHRRDPVKATRAAAKHLRDLYRAMGDWHLALSTYNCSMTRIKRCMVEMQDSTFWGIKPCLPKETQNYVPLYIAATLIASDPERYGFTNIKYDEPVPFDTVRVTEAVDLNALGSAAGVSGLEIKELNPELLQPSTPPGELSASDGYVLRVPVGTAVNFYTNYAKLTPAEKRPWMTHTVGRGESLKSIARTYGLTTEQLADYNDMGMSEKLRRGQRLRVPMSVMAPGAVATTESTTTTTAQTVTAPPAPKKSSKVTHRVRRGETLTQIASRYGVRTTDIRNWNNLSYRKGLKKGQSLTIYLDRTAAKSSTLAENSTGSKKLLRHKVRSGETLAKIADNYDVTVTDLRRWNGKSVRKGVRAGQSIKIYAEAEMADKSADSDGTARTHKVRPGESMFSIAQAYGTTVDKLAEWNGGKTAESLQAGETLKVFGANATVAKGDDPTPAPVKRSTTYRVRRGDTLYSIAERFGVDVTDLKRANQLASNKITAGKRLVIPAD